MEAFDLKPPSSTPKRRGKPSLNRISPGEPPEVGPVHIAAWSGRTPDDETASYHMVAIWPEVPENIIEALVLEGVGAGTFMLTDAEGRKSRWIVRPTHVKLYGDGSAAEEVPAEIDTRSEFDRRFEEFERLKELFGDREPRTENPVPPPSTDWAKIAFALVPMVQPLIEAAIKRLSVVPGSVQSAAASSPWADLAAYCEQHGIAAEAIRQQLEAAIQSAAGGGS